MKDIKRALDEHKAQVKNRIVNQVEYSDASKVVDKVEDNVESAIDPVKDAVEQAVRSHFIQDTDQTVDQVRIIQKYVPNTNKISPDDSATER